MDASFFLDVVLNFRTAYVAGDFLVTDTRSVAAHYLKVCAISTLAAPFHAVASAALMLIMGRHSTTYIVHARKELLTAASLHGIVDCRMPAAAPYTESNHPVLHDTTNTTWYLE
jgi:hypothetical protein